MRQLVGDAVAQVMGRPFEWAACDCCSAACDVFRLLTGVDPLAPLRGAYSGPREAVRLIRDSGGLLPLAERLAAQAGLRRVQGWAPGALALAPAGPGGVQALVIGLDQPGYWAGKSRGGWSVVTEVATIWRR